MSSSSKDQSLPPLPIGALLRFAIDDVRARIYSGVVAAGFNDLRPAHVTLFRWPGPDGMRPTELAAATQISKQAANDLLGDLERLGYLERRIDPSDERARLIRLTERGRHLQRVAVGIHSDIEKEWEQAVGHRHYRIMREALHQLVRVPEFRTAANGPRRDSDKEKGRHTLSRPTSQVVPRSTS